MCVGCPRTACFSHMAFDMQIVANKRWHDTLTTHGKGSVSHMCADQSGLWQKCTRHAQASYARGTCLVPVLSTFQDGRLLQRLVFHRLREGTSPTSAPPASVQGGTCFYVFFIWPGASCSMEAFARHSFASEDFLTLSLPAELFAEFCRPSCARMQDPPSVSKRYGVCHFRSRVQ